VKKLAAGLVLAVGVGFVVISAQHEDTLVASEAGALPAVEAARAPASLASSPVASAPTLKPLVKIAPAEAEKAARALVEQVSTLQACYGGGCNYPETDARSYNFGVGQDIKTALYQLAATARAGELQGEGLAAAAREQLKNEDGHVQEAALALLATQPTSEANLAAVLENVIAGYDAQLIQAAMTELRRYTAERDQETIAAALSGAMTSGSPFVAREVSSAITPFLQPRTVPIYEEALAAILEGSLVRRDLARSIEEYRSAH
jgi:hypothetical protein